MVSFFKPIVFYLLVNTYKGGRKLSAFPLLYFYSAENYKHKISRIKVSKKQNQKIMNNLKQGQKVFDYIKQEWGVVHSIPNGLKYPIEIRFVESGKIIGYTTDGKYSESDPLPRLSLTEWNPIENTGKYTPIDQPQETEPTEIEKLWAAIERLEKARLEVSTSEQNETREPQEGDMVYAWDKEGGVICYGELVHIEKEHMYPYVTTASNQRWAKASKKRPHWIP